MIAPTHVIFSQTFFYTSCIVVGHAPSFGESLLCAFFAVFPADVDTRQSLIGKALPFIASPTEFYFGHRTITHAFLPQLAVGIPLFLFAPQGIALAVMSGWHSHSWADMMTRPGVQFWYPSRFRCVLPGNPKYRMHTMEWGELWFAIGMCLLVFPLHNWATTGLGATGLIRQSIAFIGAARETYDESKGNSEWFLEIKGGHDNTTLQEISGRYYVVSSHTSKGFKILVGDKIKTVCESSTCDWYAESATISSGEIEHVTTFNIEVKRISSVNLQNALKAVTGSYRVFLVGTIGTKKLDYVLLEDLPTGVIEDVELAVQVRHPPNVKLAVPVIVEETAPSNDLMEKWMERVLEKKF